MCGICGIVGDPPGGERTAVVGRMMERLRHRGPDAEGSAAMPSGGAELGFRRLSIIDLDGGNQPMTGEDRRIHVVGNGEIYNFRELQAGLERRGHRFASRCDIESVVHLFEEKGIGALDDLEGMFALAIWDDRRRELVLARDRLGKKPLYYWHSGQRLVFASEIKALFEHPAVSRELDRESLPLYLAYHYVPAPRTMFAGIRKVRPGEWLRFRDGAIETGAYWTPPVDERPSSLAAAAERIRSALAGAVERRLVSDVPLGAFLSGGIDSSIVVGLMAGMLDEPVKTFSIGFEEERYSETGYARQVARHFGTEHHEFVVRADAVAVLPKLIWHYDEPFADASAVPTYYVSQQTAGHVKVALSGDGGDETFGGYRRYSVVDRLARLRRLPRPLELAAVGAMRARGLLRPSWSHRQLRALAGRRDEPLGELYAELVAGWPPALRGGGPGAPMPGAPAVDVAAHVRDPFERHPLDAVAAAAFADQVTYLPGDILTKVDVASMACSLEVRCPFLDAEVVALANSLPSRLRVRGGRRKIALRHAFRHLLPERILGRGKRGFNVPLREWFRGPLGPLLDEVVLSHEARARGWLDAGEVARLAREHRSGVADHGRCLWSLLCLELWLRTYLDPPAPRPVTLA